MKLPIPPSILRTHTIIFGMTGAGKSSVARLLVEHHLDLAKAGGALLESIPVTIVDPKGDWWGLRSSADGKGKGYPMVIFGGDHGDLPLAPESGSAVAEAVLSGNYTSLLDLSLLTLGERTRFYTDFATAYYRARTPRLLVVDEVHNFCPKGKIPDPQVGKMLHISNTIASEGRGRGIILLAASQRPQKVHNDFSSSCSTLIAMKVLHPADRSAYKDWLDGAGDKAAASEILSSAAALPKGTGWVWNVGDDPYGPSKVHFPKYRTYDSFKAQPSSATITGSAMPDLEALKERMASYLQQQADNDPAVLRRRIRELETTMKGMTVVTPEPEMVMDVEGFQRAYAKGWEDCWDMASRQIERILVQVPLLHENPPVAPQIEFPEQFASSQPHPKKVRPPRFGMAPVRQEGGPALITADPSRDNRTTGQKKILDALLWLEQASYHEVELTQLSAIANYRGGSFARARGELKTLGLVEYLPNSRTTLTAKGRAQAAAMGKSGSMQHRWREALKTEQQRLIFDALVDIGVPIARDALSKKINRSGGSFNRAIGELKTMGAICSPQAGFVAIEEIVLG